MTSYDISMALLQLSHHATFYDNCMRPKYSHCLVTAVKREAAACWPPC